MAKPKLGSAVFTQKRVFGPRTTKSQPIWMKFWSFNEDWRCYA